MTDPSPSVRALDAVTGLAAAPAEAGCGARSRLSRLGARQWSWMAPGVIGAHLAVVALAVPAAAADPSAEPRPPADEHRGAPIFLVSMANPSPPPVLATTPPVPAPARAARPTASNPLPAPLLTASNPPRVHVPVKDPLRADGAVPVPPAARAAPVSPPTAVLRADAPPDSGGETLDTRRSVAAAGGAVAAAEPGPRVGLPRAPELPAYPTRIPAPAALEYDLRRGLFSGTGQLSWQPVGDRYAARLEGRVAGLLILEWSSEGGFDAAGLAPTRYVDRRRNGNRQAANFQRDVGRVSYSGPSVEYALPVGAQDRLSWMLQIAAIAEARPAAVARDAAVSMWVSGARGDADVWVFRSQGVQTLELPGGPLSTVKLLRVPRQPYDTRVEVWLDPARGHLPVRARLTSGRDEEDALDLTLRR